MAVEIAGRPGQHDGGDHAERRAGGGEREHRAVGPHEAPGDPDQPRAAAEAALVGDPDRVAGPALLHDVVVRGPLSTTECLQSVPAPNAGASTRCANLFNMTLCLATRADLSLDAVRRVAWEGEGVELAEAAVERIA